MRKRVAYKPDPAVKPEPAWRARAFPLRALWLGLALSLFVVGHVKPQITTISQGSQLPSPQVVGSMPDPNDSPRESNPALEQQRLQEIKIERRARLVSDTDKLLKLTARLDSEVTQTRATSLTRKQRRILAKIEKLARSVKQNMSTPIQVSAF